MMLDDNAIDRYSRHLLVPEIGIVGQRRLLATRVSVDGDPRGRTALARLLERSGLQVVTGSASVAAVVGTAIDAPRSIPTAVGWSMASRLHVAMLLGAPCSACIHLAGDAPTDDESTDVLVALLATILVLHVVEPAAGSTTVSLDLATGHLHTHSLDQTRCPHCPVTLTLG